MKVKLLENVLTKATSFGGKAMLCAKKYSPEICLVCGVAGIAVGIVLACKETLKVEEIIDEGNEKKDQIEEIHSDESHQDRYTEDDYKKDKAVVWVQTAVKIGKNYLPSAAFITTGFVLIFASYHIQHTRNAAIMAAYASLSETFNKYRQRVRDDQGEDKDKSYLYGTKAEKIKITDGDGKKKTITENTIEENECQDLGYSMFARVFDESSTQFSKEPQDNRIFLHCAVDWANTRLRTHGHLFLNEIYDYLGFEHTKAGSVVGWIYGEGYQNYVDLGMFNVRKVGNREFLNGQDRYIILDFNVDGVIYDLIEKDRRHQLPRIGNRVKG